MPLAFHRLALAAIILVYRSPSFRREGGQRGALVTRRAVKEGGWSARATDEEAADAERGGR